MSVAVNAFVFDAMANSVSSFTGSGLPISRTPYPFARTTFPSLTMAMDMPGTFQSFSAWANWASSVARSGPWAAAQGAKRRTKAMSMSAAFEHARIVPCQEPAEAGTHGGHA